MANLFRKPKDESEFAKLSKEDQKEHLSKLGENFTKKDELAMLIAAFKVFLPPILVIILIIYLVTKLFV